MALIKADRVKETSTSTSTGNFTLGGAPTGFRTFASVCAVNDTVFYVIDSDSGSEWETGLGTYSATNTLTRTTVHASSNSGSLVAFSAGTKNVYISVTANQINPASSTGARSLVVRNDSGTVAITADASTSGTPPNLLLVTGPAHTGVTGDYNDIYFNLARTIQLSSYTTFVRPIRITSPTYTATSSLSPQNAYTVHITGAPTASTNVTFNNRAALGIFTGSDTAKGLVIESATWTSGQQSANLIECNRLSNTGGLFAVSGNGCVAISPMGKTGIQNSSFIVQAPNHTSLTASTEYNDVYWNLARTVEFATGAIATQRAVRISQPTYSFVGASTITNAATVQIDGAPVAGTNATITNQIALRVLTGVAAATGIVVQAATSQYKNLIEWTSSTGDVWGRINENGVVFSNWRGTNNILINTSAASFVSATANVLIGSNSGASITTASYTMAVGGMSLSNLTTGYYNVGYGYNALLNVTTGGNNIGIGTNAGSGATIAQNNVYVGFDAGRYLTNGATANTSSTESIYIGSFSKALNTTESNAIVIGHYGQGKGSNTTVVGTSSTVSTDVFGTLTTTLTAAAQKGLIVKGFTSQTANLQEWQDSAGNVLASIGANGSPQYPSSNPSGYAANQNDLVLTGSAFQRLSGTAARDITGVAPPTGLSHVDGRTMRIFNVGSFSLTLKHNSASSTAANRFYCIGAVDIIISAGDYAELIYDSNNNGSAAAGWRVY